MLHFIPTYSIDQGSTSPPCGSTWSVPGVPQVREHPRASRRSRRCASPPEHVPGTPAAPGARRALLSLEGSPGWVSERCRALRARSAALLLLLLTSAESQPGHLRAQPGPSRTTDTQCPGIQGGQNQAAPISGSAICPRAQRDPGWDRGSPVSPAVAAPPSSKAMPSVGQLCRAAQLPRDPPRPGM